MKKSFLFLFVLTLLCLMVSLCAAVDKETFEFQDGITWGMSQNEVIKALSGHRYETEHERKLNYIRNVPQPALRDHSAGTDSGFHADCSRKCASPRDDIRDAKWIDGAGRIPS